MSDFLDGLRELARAGEIVGLSAGGLIACAVLFWFIAAARPLAIAIAVTIACSAASGLYWLNVGRADVQAQWTAANAAENAKANVRDSSIEKQLEREFPPVNQVNPNDAKMLANLSAAAAGSCQLGPDALRLRQSK